MIREDKETTKLHIVFDGSAKLESNHFSLNDCLKKWLNLTLSIFDILVKFRTYPIGMAANIEKAFHQIVIVSKHAFAVAVYLWTVYSNGGVDVCLVASKTHVAPLKQQTILRLELLGATLLA